MDPHTAESDVPDTGVAAAGTGSGADGAGDGAVSGAAGAAHTDDRAGRVVAAAEDLLKRRTGAAVRLVDPVDLGGGGESVVLRVRVAENPFSLPRTLVLKQVLGSDRLLPDAGKGAAFRREAVSYQFCNTLTRQHRPGPELVAYDIDALLLVLSDLGDAPAMGELLERRDPAEVSHSLMALAQSLGRMHASTYGREEDYATLLRRIAGTDDSDPLAEQVARAVSEVPPMLHEALGTPVAEEVRAIAEAGRDLLGAGGFRAFSTADLCPDNILVNADGVRFLDYEWGGFRDATLDISYALASFPTCLCALELSRDQAEEMIEAWRAEVVSVFPRLRDDSVLYSRLLEAMVMWVWLSTWLFLGDPGQDDRGAVDEAAEAALHRHELAVGRRTALRRRWSVLAAFGEGLGERSVADHAAGVLGALGE